MLQDVYQKLIEANKGAYARQRFGGDAPSLTRGGDRPSTDVQIVALYHKAITVDGSGRAVFSLDLPDFDGRIRLMAVAHTTDQFGSAEKEMILASPLMVQATMPRFLACGDEATLMLDIHNLTDASQSLVLKTDIMGPVTLNGKKTRPIVLAPSEKTTVALLITAGRTSGRAEISCRVKGLVVDGHAQELAKSWFIETRSPYPPLTRRWKQRLAPGAHLSIPSADLAERVANSITVQASLDSEPPVNLADHVDRLMAYPYGCLEQTVSGLFPHVLLTASQFADLGVATTSPAQVIQKIDLGIQRLMEKQKSSGGFGLWHSSSPEEAWLTAYAAHFLIHATNAGFNVPKDSVKKTFQRLSVYVRQPNQIPIPRYVDRKMYRAAVRAYAAFDLSLIQMLSLGDARSVAAYTQKYSAGPLAMVQAGAALGLAGDQKRCKHAFHKALNKVRTPRIYVGDYGSMVRDLAASYYCLATWFPDDTSRSQLLEALDNALAAREWLSTQERNAMVMAGAARLTAKGTPWQASVVVGGQTGVYNGDGPGQAIFAQGAAAGGFEIKNTGTDALYVNLVLTGYPNDVPRPSSAGVSISRRFLDAKGAPVDVAQVKSGDRLIVELAVTPDKKMPHALVVDMVPAGIELEDPNVSGAFLIDDVVVDKKAISAWQSEYITAHTEYRDDRFIAALQLQGGQTRRIFYGARVVSPGRFKVPASLVEDMYRPYIRAIGNTIETMAVTLP